MYWTVSKAKRPTRTHHAAVAVRQSVYSFGGPCSGDAYSDVDHIHVHVFNTVSLSWTKLPPVAAVASTTGTGRGGGGGRRRRCSSSPEVPSIRAGHTAVLVGNTVYIWGGITYTAIFSTNDTYAFDVDTHRWSKAAVSGIVPGARFGHSACVVGTSMYVYGGLTIKLSVVECNSKVYRLDTAGAMLWSQVKTRGTPPPASSCHSATVIGTKMFVFGGWGDHEDYNVRALDTKTGCWLSVPPARLLPEARFGQSAFAHGGRLYMFGGCDFRGRNFRDLWRFSPETFSWRKVEPWGKGPSRMYGTCCCVVADHRVVLFGGYKGRAGTVAAGADDLHVLDFRPALKTLCKVAVVRWRLRRSGLPHNVRWELAAMTNRRRRSNAVRSAAPLAANKRKSDETASPPDNKPPKAAGWPDNIEAADGPTGQSWNCRTFTAVDGHSAQTP